MTKEKFYAYTNVQMSGATNMFDVNAVIQLSEVELTKEEVFDIMKNYSEYKVKFGSPNGIGSGETRYL